MTFDFSKVEFEEVNCIICKSKTQQKKLLSTKDLLCGMPGSFSIVECQKCGLVFQNPRPKEKYIGHYYPDDLGYFNIQKNENEEIDSLTKKVLIDYYKYSNLGKKNLLRKIILYPAYYYLYKHRSIPKFRQNGTILEIGCSNGLALKKLKNLQWKVKGIEINKKAADYAKNERELDVEIGSIFDFNFEPSSFDVIILDMVLEHIYNPEQAIKKISKWLKKDGQLIFSLPYFYGFEFSVFKEFSHSLHLPAHITFFNKNAIAHLLGRFSDINYVFHHFDRDIVASAEYKYQNNHNWVLKQIAKNKLLRWTIIKPLVFVMSLFKKTSRITVFATKN